MADDGERPTILIVDDAPDSLKLTSGLLKDCYKVKVANSGRKGLAVAATPPHPDLILLDVTMPDVDGHEVCRWLKADPRTRDIPVIFLTAMSSIKAEEEGLELGAADYISKPISPPILMARVRTQLSLKVSTDTLRATLEEVSTAHRNLQSAFTQLVRAEKMAALGQLVAGVAHEINTPLGIAVTAATLLEDEIERLAALADSGRMRKSEFAQFVSVATDASQLLTSHLARAARLVSSFKQIAADQSGDGRRVFDARVLLDDVMASLEPSLREGGHTLELVCPDGLHLDSYPGTLAQVLAALTVNSLTHGFEPGRAGRLTIRFDPLERDGIELVHADDGRGIAAEHRAYVFDPFFTTRRGAGNSGLGLHIVFNLVTARLGGTITLADAPGTRFVVQFPRTAPFQAS
jgi:signal transduction histidine kinase